MKDKPQGYAHLTAKIDELKRELAEAIAQRDKAIAAKRERCAKIVERYTGAELLNIWLRAGSKNQKG